MNFLQTVAEYGGLVSIIFVIAQAVDAARFVGKSKAASTATDEQEKVINAMNARLEVQERNINDLVKENARLQLILETIKAALKSRGLIITIDGEMITIGDGTSTTTTHIRQNSH